MLKMDGAQAMLVACCLCGTSIAPNPANTCAACLQSEHDILANVPKEILLFRCKGCLRFQKEAADTWTVNAPDLESKELLTLCLKRTKGLNELQLNEAKFLYTEPHSKRLKVEIEVSKEVIPNVTLQQSTILMFILKNKMCLQCHKFEAKNTWTCMVQVRQKIKHKKTFLLLEQLIIKYKMFQKCVKISNAPNGMDFFFGNKGDATQFLDFLDSVVPIQKKTSKKIISQDIKSNIANYHFTFLAEMAIICKNDLVVLPRSLAKREGTISQFVLCTQVTNQMKFVDPFTCQIANISSTQYWNNEFEPLLVSKQLEEFVVLDIHSIDHLNYLHLNNNSGEMKNDNNPASRKRKSDAMSFKQQLEFENNASKVKMKLIQVEVAKENDFTKTYIVNSHLGNYLKVGDSVMGYDLCRKNVTFSDEKDKKPSDRTVVPDIVLVHKKKPKKHHHPKNKSKQPLKLERLEVDDGIEEERESNIKEDEQIAEEFLEDLEQDEDLQLRLDIKLDDSSSETEVE